MWRCLVRCSGDRHTTSSHCQPISTVLPAHLAWLGRPSDHNSGLIFRSEHNIAIFDHFDLTVTSCDTFWISRCPASHWQLKPRSTNFGGLWSGFTVTNLISVSGFGLDEVQVELSWPGLQQACRSCNGRRCTLSLKYFDDCRISDSQFILSVCSICYQ